MRCVLSGHAKEETGERKASACFPCCATQVKAILAQAKAADASFAAAKVALYKTLSQTPVKLTVVADELSPATPTPAVTAFNGALKSLRAAVGPGLKITLDVKAAGVEGGPGALVALSKPVFKDALSPAFDLVPLTLLEIASTAQVSENATAGN